MLLLPAPLLKAIHHSVDPLNITVIVFTPSRCDGGVGLPVQEDVIGYNAEQSCLTYVCIYIYLYIARVFQIPIVLTSLFSIQDARIGHLMFSLWNCFHEGFCQREPIVGMFSEHI